MGIQERKQREKEQRINQIIEAAEKVFLSRGLDNATMDEVAQACELSKATLYLYFKSKEELFAALAFHGLVRLKERFEAAVSCYTFPADKTRALGKAYLDFYLERPENYLLIHHQQSSHPEIDPDTLHQVFITSEWFPKLLTAERELWRTCFSVIELGIADATFKPGTNPQEVVALLWASSNGIFQLMEHLRTHAKYAKEIPDAAMFYAIDPKELYVKVWEYTLDSLVAVPENVATKRIIWNTPLSSEIKP